MTRVIRMVQNASNEVGSWVQPKLVRIGQIRDVAGAPAGAVQNATKS